MRKRDKQSNIFSLSFLDVMFCGFGAVVLLVMIIHGSILEKRAGSLDDLKRKEKLLSARHQSALAIADRLQAALKQLAEEMRSTALQRSTLERALAKIKQHKKQGKQTEESRYVALAALAEELRQTLAKEKETKLRGKTKSAEQGKEVHSFSGDGRRQYLTGLQLSGRRILFLLDGSASMLDAQLANILIWRNLPDAEKRQSKKWQRLVGSTKWLLSNLPAESEYQVYVFNSKVTPLLPKTHGQWLSANDNATMDLVFQALANTTPAEGTNLELAFMSMAALRPSADNLILLTDGLPTQAQGFSLRRSISSVARTKYFQAAVDKLPGRLPVNVLLFPMEGDPEAAARFWGLAFSTGGSFMEPSRNWP